jgi:tetratricopeptide (TPR) repeat protein
MNTKTLAVLSLGFLIAFGASAFAGQAAADTAKIVEQTGPGVLKLSILDKDKQEVGRGTAFVVDPTTAVTSYHLICQAVGATSFNVKGKEVDVDGVLAVNKSLDLALLKIDGKVTPLPVGSFDSLAAGKKVFAVGVNEAGDFIASSGEVRAVIDLGKDVKVADTSLAVPETFSGAIVLNEAGQVVGLLNVPDSRLRFVVPASAANALTKPAKETAWKSWTGEDYKAGLEFAWLAGRLYDQLGDSYNAQKYLDKVAKAQPTNVEVWNMLARSYDKQRDYSSAVTAFRKVTELAPQNAEAFFGLGRVLVRTQKSAEAVAALEKAVALDPANTEAYLYIANAYEDSREFQKAGDAYEKYLAGNPPNAWSAYQRLGMSRINANQFEQAAAALAEAAKAQPQDQTILYNLAQAYQKSGKIDKAEETYVSLAGISPKDAPNWYSYILDMYSKASNWPKAIDAAKKIAELKPNDDQAIYNVGLIYQQLQKYPEAIEQYKKTVAIKPTNDLAWFQIGYCYYSLKNFKEAIPAMQKNVDLVPDHVFGWMYIGMSWMQMKNFDKALEPMKKAVESQPDNANALFNLGVIYLNLKDRYSAQEIAKRLQAVDANLAAKLRSYIK